MKGGLAATRISPPEECRLFPLWLTSPFERVEDYIGTHVDRRLHDENHPGSMQPSVSFRFIMSAIRLRYIVRPSIAFRPVHPIPLSFSLNKPALHSLQHTRSIYTALRTMSNTTGDHSHLRASALFDCKDLTAVVTGASDSPVRRKR